MTTEKNEEMTSEEVLTCAINIGEQLLVSGAEISRVEDTIRRICNAYGIRQSHIFSIASCIIVTLETKDRKWITQTRRILSYGTDMWKLDRLNDLSRRICATQPSFEVIDREYEKILKGPTYSPAVQCGIYAMTAGAFAIFFGGNLWDGFASLFVGALIRVTLYALSAIKLGDLLQYPLLSDLRYGMYSCLLPRDRTACRDDHDREYHAPDPGSPDDELIPGFHQRGHDQRTSAFFGGDDHSHLCGSRVYSF